MGLTAISAATALTAAQQSLRLPKLNFEAKSMEFIAAAIRRAAADHCPCPPRTIAASVLASMEGLDAHIPSLEEVDDAIEAVTAYGDLIEFTSANAGEPLHRQLLVPAPPRFVLRQSGSAFILGIAPGDVSPLNAALDRRMEFTGYSRRITPQIGDNLGSLLSSLGIEAWDEADWLRMPFNGRSEDLISIVTQELVKSPLPAGVDNLQIANFDSTTDFYAGRWQLPRKGSNGDFIGRIPVQYGAPGWCVVRIVGGSITHLAKFPFLGTGARACDEAWLVLSAFDKSCGRPQVYATVDQSDGRVELRLFSPVPAWIQRRLHLLGKQNPRAKGCLLAFSFASQELVQEARFLETSFWLVEREERRLT
jgi:hypothetical protein